MRFLPVLDIRGGIVVRALAGRRSEYRPLVSQLTDSTDPVVVAEAIRADFGWTEFYVADLDAINRFRPRQSISHSTLGCGPPDFRFGSTPAFANQ